MKANPVLWSPSKTLIDQANITTFLQAVNQQFGLSLGDYASLYQWSIDYPEDFWSSFWGYADIIADRGKEILSPSDKMINARWFSDSKLNFAENLLRQRNQTKTADQTAIVFWGENRIKRRISNTELYQQIASVSRFLKENNVQSGDVVAGFMANVPETLIFMLATTSIGAIWTSCSPDFGVQGVLDRFGQVKPKILISVDAYYYNGKAHDCIHKLNEILPQLNSVQYHVTLPYAETNTQYTHKTKRIEYQELLNKFTATELSFKRLPFNAPLYIMYSSGTTGVPKCIVHGIGGTLIQHLKEHLLHVDVKPEDKVFYFTTCGWMMWNWLVSSLATGTTLMLYDGSPFYPDANILFNFAEQEKISVFGTSAKYIDVLNNQSLDIKKTHSLKALRNLLSTGSVLSPESFDYIYQNIKADLCVSSISGGTDIISCFALGCPTVPVRRGELQCKGLAMQVEVWNEKGQKVINQKGELVCTRPFPSMPIYFWNDPDKQKYHSAYFEDYPNVWCHGDYVLETEQGGLIFYGRSDTVLNPGGVRIGTAEIYRQVEKLTEVDESIVIGQIWEDDVRIVLFVKLAAGLILDDTLIDKIKKHIRENTTPRHVPAVVLQVNDIPRTKSGKIVELAVRSVVHGEPIKNKEALANPEALNEYSNRPEIG